MLSAIFIFWQFNFTLREIQRRKWMRYLTGCVVMFIVLAGFSVVGLAAEKSAPEIEKASLEQQISYAIGYDIFEKLKEVIDLDPDFFFLGAKDSQKDTPQVTEERLREFLMSYQQIARQKQAEKIKIESEKNRAEGARFLDENKKKEGVVTLASGLQYKIITEGTGPRPTPQDTVECHYIGTLIDGTVFDSSHERGEPAVFQVGGVIPGWVEALQKMKVGAKWILYIPSDLAYGDRGAGEQIKPGSTLIFEVELLGIME